MKNKIISEFQTLIDGIMATRPMGWQFKVGVYRKAQKTLRFANGNIDTFNEAKSILSTVFKNPNSLLEKIEQLYKTGKINQVEKIKSDSKIEYIKLLSSVPYIGQAKAKTLVEDFNIITISELKKNTKLLNDNQKLGLKYYDELIDPKTLDTRRISRDEIDTFYKYVKAVAKKLDMIAEIAGSYRRQHANSGDIDIILTGKTNKMGDFVQNLKQLKESFVNGNTKWMGIGIIERLPRRVDVMFTSLKEYPFALMYFTGSQEFNKQMREYAKKMGYRLNEHGITKLDGSSVKYDFNSESDIFKFLNSSFVRPAARITFSHNQQLKKNVSIKDSKIVSVVYDVSKGVTLAETYDESKHKVVGMLMSEKFDGVRAIWDGRTLRSRANKEFHPPEWFINELPKNMALDGELFTECGKFQKTVSIIKKLSPINSEWKTIKYKVFDSPSMNGTYLERYARLQDSEQLQVVKHVEIVDQMLVMNKAQMKTKYERVLKKGGEGLILRNPSMQYVQKRTKDLLKVKPSDDDEATIVNMMEGKKKDAGRMGALVVELKSNRSIRFKIGTGFTNSMRQNFWNRYDYYKNRNVTFSHKGLTNSGKPRHSVYMRMRNIA
tara:strand:+ start:608 stop:2425 length:1818 start_codon:yes stop_codon:yes gene_type:complete